MIREHNVIAGLVPAIQWGLQSPTAPYWMPGTSPGMTRSKVVPGVET